MKRVLLDCLLIKEILGYFIFGVALFTTILVAMQELQPLTSMVVEHGVPISTAFQIFTLSLPYFMALAFPMSMLLSTLLAFGRLSGDSETTALLAAGVSYYRMAIPVALIGVGVSLLAIGFNEVVAPAATSQKNRLYGAAIAAGVPSNRPFHTEKMNQGGGTFILNADNYDGETKKLVHPTLVFYDGSGKPTAIEWAETGVWRNGLSWDLYNGFIQRVGPTASFQSLSFAHWRTTIEASLEQLVAASQDANGLTFSQLKSRILRKQAEHHSIPDIDTDLVTLYSKISIPFASLVFAFIGFPLGIRRQRSGSAVGFALSIGIIFIYYLIYQYASILGNNGAVPPLVSAWVPDGLGAIVGFALLRQASR